MCSQYRFWKGPVVACSDMLTWYICLINYVRNYYREPQCEIVAKLSIQMMLSYKDLCVISSTRFKCSGWIIDIFSYFEVFKSEDRQVITSILATEWPFWTGFEVKPA